MDIMDSSDTPETTMNAASNRSVVAERDLPLSVDESENIGSPSHYQSSASNDNVASGKGSAELDLNRHDGLPTSTDDITMQTQQHIGPTLSSTYEALKEKVNETVQSVESKLHSATAKSPSMSSSSSGSSDSTSSLPIPSPSNVLDTDVSAPVPDDSFESGIYADAGNNSGGVRRTAAIPPSASTMRDSHLHAGMVSLPTHANEKSAPSADQHRPTERETAAVNRAAAADLTEPKDPSSSSSSSSGGGGFSDSLKSFGDKISSGMAMMREKVDNWTEENISSSPDQSSTKTTTVTNQPPTMINKNDQHMADLTEARQQQGQNA